MFRKTAQFLGAAFAVAFLISGEARAGTGDAVFEKIKGALVGQVDPDAIEMARFSIARPAEAATVYSRAAAQDYPFFALVGAVKAARNRDFPQIGTFTYDRCMTPITAIDAVFAGASSTIDNAQGQASTNAAMATAAGIAAQYAKAQTDAARSQLVEQLSQAVPYFRDIPTICAFAFETDLQAERNLNLIASQLSQDIRTAYVAFSHGDVVTGTAVLLSLGAGKQVVCTMVDNAVAGGAIGRTPLLGTLAKDACAGFVGSVIDGVTGLVKGGVGAVEDGVLAVGGSLKSAACAVYSFIGSGCSSAEPPPTALGNAGAWCAARGGIGSFMSKSNDPGEYMLECNDGSKCSASAGTPAKCATGAEIAAHDAQVIATNEAEFQAGLPKLQAAFDARWLPRCADEACKSSIRAVRDNATELATRQHHERPDYVFMMATHFPFEAADRQAVKVIDDADYRVRPAQWANNFRARWNDKCQDNQCRTGVQFAVSSAHLLVQQRAAANPRPTYDGTAPIYATAEAQGATLFAESTQRSIDFNKTTTANAGAAWEKLTNGIWLPKCADPQCLGEIKQLSAQMRVAGNLLQAADPEASSLSIQNKVAPEYNPKFKAAVDASQARAAATIPVVAPMPVQAVGALEPLMQKRNFSKPVRMVRVAYVPTTPPPVVLSRVPAAPTRSRSPSPTGPIRPMPGGPLVTMVAGMDRMGGDYRGFALDRAEPQLCRQACADEAACRSYTYVNPGLKGPRAMCFLKNVTPPANADRCCTSGEKAVAPAE